MDKLSEIKKLNKKTTEKLFKSLKADISLNEIVTSKDFVRQITYLNDKMFLLKLNKKIMYRDNIGLIFKNIVLKTNKNEMNQILISGDNYDDTGVSKNKINDKSVMFLLTYVYEDKEDLENNKYVSLNIKKVTNIRLKSENPKSGKTYRYSFDILEETETNKERIEQIFKDFCHSGLNRQRRGVEHEKKMKNILLKEYNFVEKIDSKGSNNVKKILESLFKNVVKIDNIKTNTADFICYQNKKNQENLIKDLEKLKEILTYNNMNNTEKCIINIKDMFKQINEIFIKNEIKLYSAKKIEKIEKKDLIKDMSLQFNEENLIGVTENLKGRTKFPSLILDTKDKKYKFVFRIDNFKKDKVKGENLYVELVSPTLGITIGKINLKLLNNIGIEVNQKDCKSIVNCFQKLSISELSFVLNIMRGSFLTMEYIH